ncbi:MAG: ABC transporter substrate-binding protein [Betaproteobacteria bacterium]
MRIVLAENFRAIFYAPFYACLALGFFRARGLDVVMQASPSPGAGIADMMSGSTHLVWGGPMRVLKDRNDKPAGPDSLVAFGEVAARDPFYLIGRPELLPFSLSKLTALRLAAVSEVVTPWLCLQQDLRDLGVDPDAIERSADAPMQDNLNALKAGTIDVLQAFEPLVTLAQHQGIGVPLHAAHTRGPTAYTTFLSTQAHLDRHGDSFQAMAGALESFLPWLAAEGIGSLAQVVGHLYPHVAPEVLVRSLERCQATQIWSCRPEISIAGFDRLAQSLVSAGFITHAAAYQDCVAPWARECPARTQPV